MPAPPKVISNSKGTSDAEQSEVSTNGSASANGSPPTGVVAEVAGALPEAATASFAALLHLIRLMAGDLVLHRPDADIERFEQAVRSKIDQFTSPTRTSRHAMPAWRSRATSSNRC